MSIYALCRQLSPVEFTHFLSSNPPVCQNWGAGRGGQANFGNAKILRAPVTPTPQSTQIEYFKLVDKVHMSLLIIFKVHMSLCIILKALYQKTLQTWWRRHCLAETVITILSGPDDSEEFIIDSPSLREEDFKIKYKFCLAVNSLFSSKMLDWAMKTLVGRV